MHAQRKLISAQEGLPPKTGGIPNLTLGILVERLNTLKEHGATEDTPIQFEGSCVEEPEIRPIQGFDAKGDLIIERIFVR